MDYLAHSKDYCGYEQSYGDHVSGTEQWVRYTLEKWKPFLSEDIYTCLEKRLLFAAEFHDLGKLVAENQAALHDDRKREKLPYPHQYTGTRYLYDVWHELFGAVLIYSHHRPGLPNLRSEAQGSTPFCGAFAKNEEERRALQAYAVVHEEEILSTHMKATGRNAVKLWQKIEEPASALEIRMMLSSLVNADWSDTGRKDIKKREIPRRWGERLRKLDDYVVNLSKRSKSEKSKEIQTWNVLRQDFYIECRNSFPAERMAGIYSGDACVGTGKTTAFLALALRFAMENNLRHIFIISPLIALLGQTEKVVKDAVVLEGENKDEIVAVLHSRAEYNAPELRNLAGSWEAPVILTTAVNFYETLAANKPAQLKKLQELPGSVIILDEFHASAPATCIPVIWQWLGELSQVWGCPVILSSGTMVHFWENERFKRVYGKKDLFPIPELILPEELQRRMEKIDRTRVRKRLSSDDLKQTRFSKISELLDFALAQEGPRVILAETREAAARITYELHMRGKRVCHLSNAFTPEDCERILRKVESILSLPKENEKKRDFILVTTTFAGMGLNLSFRTGFCQMFSCEVFLQLLGRLSRNREYPDAALWSFELADSMVPGNSSMRVEKEVWREILHNKNGDFTLWSLPPSQLASYAFKEKIKRNPVLADRQRYLLNIERGYEFDRMAQEFKIITDEMQVLAVADPELIEAIKKGKHCDRVMLQRKSITLYESQVKQLDLERILNNEDLYELKPGQYDPELYGCFKKVVDTA